MVQLPEASYSGPRMILNAATRHNPEPRHNRPERPFGEFGKPQFSTLLTDAENIESKDRWGGFDCQ